MVEGFGSNGAAVPSWNLNGAFTCHRRTAQCREISASALARGKPGLIWSLEQCKQCFFAVVVFCLFVLYNIFFLETIN